MVQYEVKFKNIQMEMRNKLKEEIIELKREFIKEVENKLFYFKVRYEDSVILDSFKIIVKPITSVSRSCLINPSSNFNNYSIFV